MGCSNWKYVVVLCNNELITFSLLLITTITTALLPIITGDKSGTNGVVMAVMVGKVMSSNGSYGSDG